MAVVDSCGLTTPGFPGYNSSLGDSVFVSPRKAPLSLSKSGPCRQILVKIPNIKFYENPCSGSRGVTRGQTDMVKAIGAFFAPSVTNALKRRCRAEKRFRFF